MRKIARELPRLAETERNGRAVLQEGEVNGLECVNPQYQVGRLAVNHLDRGCEQYASLFHELESYFMCLTEIDTGIWGRCR